MFEMFDHGSVVQLPNWPVVEGVVDTFGGI